MVPGVGLEPTQCQTPRDFESRASTNFAIPAYQTVIGYFILNNAVGQRVFLLTNQLE